MHSKIFTRLFLLMGMMGMLTTHSFADEIQIGSGTDSDVNLPTHSYYKYSYSQQIYTADEITNAEGGAGTVNSIAFYNKGTAKTRNIDVYLVNTDKASFSGTSDWIPVTSSDLVFSGEFTFNSDAWNTIVFNDGFAYTGDNLAVIVDDNTGNDVSGLSCYVFTASETQSHYFRRDGSDISATSPGTGGSCVTKKNIIILDITSDAVTCAKPKGFNAVGVSAHVATLTWTAGDEDQDNWDVFVTTDENIVPDDYTTPTYQVTECQQELNGLTSQTTYYAYVRAFCNENDKSGWVKKIFTTTREALAVNASNPYAQYFETANDWSFANGTLTNKWCWGSTVNNGGEKAMYVSKDDGTTYEYTHANTVIYASKLFNFDQGTYTFTFNWQANGESNYDYLRVALVPGDMEFTASTNLPTGVGTSSLPSTWIALDGGSKLNLKDSWQTQTAEASLNGTYTMVFLWRNDNSGGSQPPAAIDNISISYMSCPRPTNLTANIITGRTATLTWTENGTATNWVLQYATNNIFTENFGETNVSETASTVITGLLSETKYYVRVKSVLGEQESSWSDVKEFTTLATCEKPTLSFVSNSNTAHTGTVSWTGNADNYELIYSTKYSFEPGDEGVIQIDLENVNTYTLQDLAPETTYRVKARAYCGEEDGYSQWSNQISFATTATCVAPSSLSGAATSSAITLSWIAGTEGQDAWDIRYKRSSDSDYTYIHIDNQTATSFTITGLTAVTTYNLNVRAYCSEEDQSKWGYSAYNQNSDLSITTECAAVTMPYTCDFEGALETSQSSNYPMPKCWARKEYRGGYEGSYTYYPSVRSASYSQPYAHGGNGESSNSGKSLHFYKPYTSTDEAAILPEIDEQYNISDLQISFWARLESYQTNKALTIGVMTDPTNISTFESVETITVKDATFQEYTAFLTGYNGDGRFIAIRFNTSTTGYIFVDDVTVDLTPTCRMPRDFEAGDVTDSEVTLTWTAGNDETLWNVQFKKASSGEWSESVVVNETTCTLHELKRATAYDVRVQAVCSDDDQSDWAETSFTTDCGICIVDAENYMFEDFENVDASDFPPICWEKFSHEMTGYSYWYLNSNNGLGSSAAYSSYNSGYAFLVMPKMHLDGNAKLSFDYLIGSGDYDESCSVVVSTGKLAYTSFTEVVWEADPNSIPTGKTSCVVSLADFDNQDIYVAFKYKGSGTSGCTWYIDNVKVYVEDTQTTDLVAGWNWWSTYVDITLDQLKEAIAGALGTSSTAIIKSQESSINYQNGQWRGNGIESLDMSKMYEIKTSVACQIELTGALLIPVEHPITIRKGNNWIMYNLNENMSLTEAFAGLEPAEGDIVKSQYKSAIFNNGQWRGLLNTLEPGRGYIYKSQANGEKTFTFPMLNK